MKKNLFTTNVWELVKYLSQFDPNHEVEIFVSNPNGKAAEQFDVFNIYKAGDDNSNICAIELRRVADRPNYDD